MGPHEPPPRSDEQDDIGHDGRGGEFMKDRVKRVALALGWVAALLVAAGAGWRV